MPVIEALPDINNNEQLVESSSSSDEEGGELNEEQREIIRRAAMEAALGEFNDIDLMQGNIENRFENINRVIGQQQEEED